MVSIKYYYILPVVSRAKNRLHESRQKTAYMSRVKTAT